MIGMIFLNSLNPLDIIIGTFQEKGASTFWNLATRLPVQGSPIVAWKFCHTLHKVLREGHERVSIQRLYNPICRKKGDGMFQKSFMQVKNHLSENKC